MEFVKILHQGESRWGIPTEDSIALIQGNPLEGWKKTGEEVPLQEVEYLPPVEQPGKIVCVGWNYLKHTREDDRLPEYPSLFMKAPTALLGSGKPLLVPREVSEPKYEAEIVVVIGQSGRYINPDQAKDHVLGYSCGNDFTAKEVLEREKIFTHAKGYDGFAPLGPKLVTDFDFPGKTLVTRVNGEIWQQGSTDEMIFTPDRLIAYISGIMTLHPWDLIFTGTPRNSKVVAIGDAVEVEITGLGILKTTLESEKRDRDWHW